MKKNKDENTKTSSINEKVKKVQNKVNVNNKNSNEFLGFLGKNRISIYCFVCGLLLMALITVIIWPDRIATLSDGTQPVVSVNGEDITADYLYEEMKNAYPITYVINYIDKAILDSKYEEDSTMTEEVKKTAQSYLDFYSQYYQWDEATFLSNNGFSSIDEFYETLKLDYRRNLYYEEYLKAQITEDDINKYYEENVYGDINTEHLLVEVNDDMTEEDAKVLAEEIISKLNDGKTFDEVKEEYSDKVVYEDLKYVAFNANLEDPFLEELRNLSENSYSKTPVKTSYGYHVIHRKDQKEKPALEDVKDTIIEELSAQMDAEDENLFQKVLVKMREEAGIKFSDSVMESKYQEFIKDYK